LAKTIPVTETRGGGGAPPLFERVAIVGFGLIGGSLGLAIRQTWPSSLVIAVDSKSVIETAMRMGAADVGGDDLVLAGDAQLIVLAAPVLANNALLGELAEYVAGDALVTDVGSTKRATMTAAEALPPRLPFVGGHPLAGAAASGVDAARPDLFTGRPWLLTPPLERPAPGLERLTAFVEALGALPRVTSADDHDRLLAYLSHLPQLVASALMDVVGTHAGESGLALAGRGLRDTTRLAESPAAIWRDIARTNPDHLRAALDELIETLEAVKADVGGGDAVLERVFASAAAWKRRFPPI
jgi:prephenate dehydrogenase